MLTRVVAKQAKTTKVENEFVNGKKNLKEYSVVFLVEGEKFNLGYKVQAKSSNLPRRFCSNLTCDQALFSFRSVKHSGATGETKNRA